MPRREGNKRSAETAKDKAKESESALPIRTQSQDSHEVQVYDWKKGIVLDNDSGDDEPEIETEYTSEQDSFEDDEEQELQGDDEDEDEDDQVKSEKQEQIKSTQPLEKKLENDGDDDEDYDDGYGSADLSPKVTASQAKANASANSRDEKKPATKAESEGEYDDDDYEDEDDFEEEEEEEEEIGTVENSKPTNNAQKVQSQKPVAQTPEPYEESVESVHDEQEEAFEEEEVEDEPITPPQNKAKEQMSSNYTENTAQGVMQGKSLVSESFSSPTGHQDSSQQSKPPPKSPSIFPPTSKRSDPTPSTKIANASSIPAPSSSLPSVAASSKPAGTSSAPLSKGKSINAENSATKLKGNPYTNKPNVKGPSVPEIPRIPPRQKPPRPSAKSAPVQKDGESNAPHPPSELPASNTGKPRSQAKGLAGHRRIARPSSKASEKKQKVLVKRGKSPSYVNFVEMENLLSEKDMMIEQLRGEVKTLEAVKRRYEKDFVALSDPQESIQKKMNGFQYEIRSLKDRLKSVQERSAMSERTIQNQEDYIIQLKTHCRKLEAILKSRNLSMDLVEAEERLRAELEEKEISIKDLRRQLKTMQDARESDYKKFKGMVKVAEAEAAQTRKEMEKIVQQMTEKDNELKVNNVKLEKEMSKKRRQLLEAQKQLAAQIQAQNAQVIPPNVPHNATPPSGKADAKDYSSSATGRDPSPTKKALTQVSQSPVRRSPSPIKKASSQAHSGEPSDAREPSESTEELSNPNRSPPKKAATKPPAAPRQTSLAKVDKPSNAMAQPTPSLSSATAQTNSQAKSGMTSHPSISSLPMSSFAKGSKPEEQVQNSHARPSPPPPAKPTSVAKSELQSEKQSITQPPIQAHIPAKAAAQVVDEEPEIDDGVVYESQDDDRRLLTPTKPSSVSDSKVRGSLNHAINKSRELDRKDEKATSIAGASGGNGAHSGFLMDQNYSNTRPESSDIAPPVPTESPRVGARSGDDDDEDYSDFESEPVEEDGATENNQKQVMSENVSETQEKNADVDENPSLMEQESQAANPKPLQTYSPDVSDDEDLDDDHVGSQPNEPTKENSQESGGKTVGARAELIGNGLKEVLDDDLPNIVNQQNKDTDESRWRKKSTPDSEIGYVPSQSDAKRPIGGRMGAATSNNPAPSSEAPTTQPLQARHRIASAASDISQISMGHTDNVRASKALSPLGGDVPEEEQLDIPPQDSILKPAFNRPKKKYF
eukprot:TRINITY_DN6630_c0_g1_i9.p1 TRINITY_DN6630_c0_g1~~TRINITY_DN6630_c0_g1_i9.p1  ORF type:complete len:1223 (-),score=392.45 TRINITY_DN6630_c0_g1_i9:411-4079(-)